MRHIAIGLGIVKAPPAPFRGAPEDPGGIGALIAGHPDGIVRQ